MHPAPLPLRHVPTIHWHVEAPFNDVVNAGHAMHDADPIVGAYVPGAQGVPTEGASNNQHHN